nr:MAG TPA: hypothetical protein [Caudoviricetes sp.]DAK60617.1 MAG TPA: hypothetical protein [Caudoviricetes sp.]
MDETHDDMTSYQRWEHGMIEDIGHDTDSIIKMLGSEKMGESFDTGALMGMLANKGVDPGIIAMLNDCKEKGAWGGDGGMLVILFLILIMGFGGGSGFFGGANRDVAGVDRTVVNEANYSRMLDAIGGNREAISQLAQTLNCTQGQITAALAGVDKQIAVNQGSIINAVQSCCCNIQGKIQDCCCQTNLNIERQGCQTRADIQDVRYLVQSTASAQDNLMQSLFSAQNAYLADQFCQIKSREDQREIQSLRDKLSEQRDNANTLAILNAIANKDAISFQGTAGATAFTGTGSLS